jgi:uncharacterized protein
MKMSSNFVIIFLIAIAFPLVIIQNFLLASPDVNSVIISGKRIEVDIADDYAEWNKGLMFVENLPEGRGMLFVFPDEVHRSFWMKNTLIPLDIIFISSDLKIVDFISLQPCEQDPCPSYRSSGPSRYVLEVNAGFVEENRIKKGEEVSI